MKKIVKNTYKSKITSLVGIVVYILTTWLIFKGTIPFWVDGFVGYSIGTVLLFAPDTIITILSRFVGRDDTNVPPPQN